MDDQPYCFLLSDQILSSEEDLDDLHKSYLSKSGKTISIDFAIGNPDFLGKGLAAPTLQAFLDFYRSEIDPEADTFFIGPEDKNPRAQHVYEKAGFCTVEKYAMIEGAFEEQDIYLMVKEYNQES